MRLKNRQTRKHVPVIPQKRTDDESGGITLPEKSTTARMITGS
jgi:hypothetical protein